MKEEKGQKHGRVGSMCDNTDDKEAVIRELSWELTTTKLEKERLTERLKGWENRVEECEIKIREL